MPLRKQSYQIWTADTDTDSMNGTLFVGRLLVLKGSASKSLRKPRFSRAGVPGLVWLRIDYIPSYKQTPNIYEGIFVVH